MRVWDSTAELRYLVLPERPPGTEGLSEEELAELVTRDAMIGVAQVEGAGGLAMNGAHDLGGMHGFGPVVLEPDEPVFHAEWERRTFALNLAMGGWRRWNLDMSRHAREQMPPAEYLATSYYEHWLWGLERLLERHGFLARAEIDRRVRQGADRAPARRRAPAGRAPARGRPPAPPEPPRGAPRRPGAPEVQGRRRGPGAEREPRRSHAASPATCAAAAA